MISKKEILNPHKSKPAQVGKFSNDNASIFQVFIFLKTV